MFFSVIVPIYNVEKYLSRCIDSVLSQTFADFELILVDDGSPDNCPEICDKYAQKDHRIKVVHKENAGLGMARNLGVEVATGDFICFIDSDDFIEEECLNAMYSAAEENKVDLVICDYYKYFENGQKDHIAIIPFFEKNNSKCSVTSMPGAVCKLVKKNIVIKSWF